MRPLASSPRPLPVVLAPLPDELLSSWLGRHASFYGVTGGRLLRHCCLEAAFLRDLDLELTRRDQSRLAYLLRCDPRTIQRMTQPWGGNHPAGLIATVRPMQVCSRCSGRHQAKSETRGARLRSWMQGWRIDCPVCRAALREARPQDVLARVDPAVPLLAMLAGHARVGEEMVIRVARARRPDAPVIALMRHLLLPRASRPRETVLAGETPRLLDAVVPGFDRFLIQSSPGFRRPGTMLLPMGVRIAVLAGVARVASRPDYWTERLLGAVVESARPRLAACLRRLPGA